MPTDAERSAWAKAIHDPTSLTPSEKLTALGLPDPETQETTTRQVTGLSVEQLQNKALTTPESLTLSECTFIQSGYRILSPAEIADRQELYWSDSDRDAILQAQIKLRTRREWDIERLVEDRVFKLSEERNRVVMEGYRRDMEAPCAWVRRVIGGGRKWGFVVLRDERTEGGEGWEGFLREVEGWIFNGVAGLKGGDVVNSTREFLWGEGVVDESDEEGLKRYVYSFEIRIVAYLNRAFQETLPTEGEGSPFILRNTFLLVTPEVVSSCAKDNTQEKWIWAYDANSDPKTTASENGDEQYRGRVKVNLRTLFTWFYAVRSEELHSMDTLWRKAQQDPEQAYLVGTTGGIYHHPLVKIEPGVNYPFNSYELRRDD